MSQIKVYFLKVGLSLLIFLGLFRIVFGPISPSVRVLGIEALVTEPLGVTTFTNLLSEVLTDLGVKPPFFANLSLTWSKRINHEDFGSSSANIYLKNGKVIRVEIDATGRAYNVRYIPRPECLVVGSDKLPTIYVPLNNFE